MYPIIGVSVLLKMDGCFLFELQKPSKWNRDADGRLCIGMGCIGGHVEPGEDPGKALEREALEEIGCRVALEKPTEQLAVDPQYGVEGIKGTDLPPDCHFVWEGEGPGFIPGVKVAVYVGRPVERPRVGDLGGVLCMEPRILFACGRQDLRVEDAMAQGAGLIEAESIPRSALLRPVGTAAVLIGLHRAGAGLADRLLA